MSEMTNNQIVKRLREIAEFETDMFGERLRQPILALADELQPKPEFKVGDWVRCDAPNPEEGGYYGSVYAILTGGCMEVRLLGGHHVRYHSNSLRAFPRNPRDVLDAYADGKLISTAGLPELPEDYRWKALVHDARGCLPDDYESVFVVDGQIVPRNKAVWGSYKVPYLAICRKDTTEQPSPTGES